MEKSSNSVVEGKDWGAEKSGPAELVTHSREVHMFQLTEQELNQLCDSGNYKTLDLALFALCLGADITLVATMLTVDITDAKKFAAFIAAVIVFSVGSLFFLVRGIIAWRQARSTLQHIKGG